MPSREQIAKAKGSGQAAGAKNKNRQGSNPYLNKSGKGNAKLAEIFDGAWVMSSQEAGHQ